MCVPGSSRCVERGGGVALPAVVIVTGIVALVGLSGASRVCASRDALDRLRARQLLLEVAESAFEEASARLEGMFDHIPFPGLTDARKRRNLRHDIAAVTGRSWPSLLQATLTQAAFRADGVEVGPVAIRVADWSLETFGRARPLGRGAWAVGLREMSVVEMTVPVGVSRKVTQLRGDVRVRRYVSVCASGDGTRARLRVEPRDLVLRFTEQSCRRRS